MERTRIQDAHTHHAMGDIEKALKSYEEILDEDGGCVEAYIGRSGTRILMEDYVDALKDAEEALRLDPSSEFGWFRKSVSNYHLGRLKEAEENLAEGLRFHPKSRTLNRWKKQACLRPDRSKPSTIDSIAHTSRQKDLKREFYQTETHLNVSLYIKGCSKEEIRVLWRRESVDIFFQEGTENEQKLHLSLFSLIDTEGCSFVVHATKVELKLKKLSGTMWPTLEKTCTPTELVPRKSQDKASATKWDTILNEYKEEDPDKQDDDAELQKFFRNIYAGADEDARRAMNKSFVESNGTVLSTNWGEIGKVQVQPRLSDNAEVKKYEQ